MKLRNISPLGELDLPLVGRILTAGEIFDVNDEQAGREPAQVVDEDGQESLDPGEGLLAQVGVYEPAPPIEEWTRAELEQYATTSAGLDVSGAKNKRQIIDAIESGTDVPASEEPS